MNSLFKKFCLYSGSIGVLMLAGGTAMATDVNASQPSIELVGSRSIVISKAWLEVTDAKLVLRGEVTNRFPTRAPLPGFLQIELIAATGGVFKQAFIAYRRNSIKSNTARFTLPIPYRISQFNAIRITHHDPGTRTTDPSASPWRDLNRQD